MGQPRYRPGSGGCTTRSHCGGRIGRGPVTGEPCRGGVRPRPIGQVVGQTHSHRRSPTPGPLDGASDARLRCVFDEVVVRAANHPIAVVAVTGRVVDEPSSSLAHPGGRASRAARAERTLPLNWNLEAWILEMVSQTHVGQIFVSLSTIHDDRPAKGRIRSRSAKVGAFGRWRGRFDGLGRAFRLFGHQDGDREDTPP